MSDRISRDVDSFMQARGIAATALSDMTALLASNSQPSAQGAPFLAFAAALQIIADGYLALGFTAEQAEDAMHHGVAVACRRQPVPTSGWTAPREGGG